MAIRSTSSPRSWNASGAGARQPAALLGGLVGCSATIRCAISNRGWPGPTSPIHSVRPTSRCCCPRKWRSSTTSGKLTLVVAEPEVPGAFKRARSPAARLRQVACAGVDPDGGRGESAPAVSSFGEAEFKDRRAARQGLSSKGTSCGGAVPAHEQTLAASPLSLYRAIRTLNPSPYMFFFNFEDFVRRGLLAGDPGAPRGRRRDGAPDRGDPQARPFARRGPSGSSRTCSDEKERGSISNCSISVATIADAGPKSAR